MRNPYKLILSNAKGAQNGWNKKHQKVGINRRVKEFTITWRDIEKVFEDQNFKSKWLGIPINPMDVFRKHYPLSPSLDRLDNDKDYTPDNICISTRFENYGFNKCSDEIKKECIDKLLNDISSIRSVNINMKNNYSIPDFKERLFALKEEMSNNRYIKSDTCTYNKFKNELDYNYETYNGVLLKTPLEERLEQNEIRAIVCLFDHIQSCPNARFVTYNGDIYFSQSKTRSFNSIDEIENYLDRVRKIHSNAEFSFYYATRDIEPKKYKLRFGVIEALKYE